MLKNDIDITIDEALLNSYMAPYIFSKISINNLKLIDTHLKIWIKIIITKCPQSKERDRIEYQCKHALFIIENNIKSRENM